MANNEQFIGPFSSLLALRLKDALFLMDSRDYIGALLSTEHTLRILDPDIKIKPRMLDFKKECTALLIEVSNRGGMNKGHVARNRLQAMNQLAYRVLDEYFADLVNELHRAGYWSFEKYGSFYDLSGGKRSE